MKKFLSFSLLMSISATTLAANDYVLPPAKSYYDETHKYYVDLLQKVLDITSDKYPRSKVKVISDVMTQGRAVKELSKLGGMITINRMGTSIKREKKLRAIKIPLTMGALGKRIFIIHKDNAQAFAKVKTLKDLQKFTACQGDHWPDSDIMESAGIKVLRNAVFEPMYSMVQGGRCDFFPRAINEAYTELLNRKKRHPDLIIEENLMLSYDFPMYFFVGKNQKSMYDRVSLGLTRLKDNGEFMKLLKLHQATAPIFPISKWKERKVIHINNPHLPKGTPLNDSKLWLNFK